MSEPTKLKPCPHCGATDSVSTTWRGSAFGISNWVFCQCGSTGPSKLNKQEAIEAWNRRAPSTEAEPEMVEPCPECGNPDVTRAQLQKAREENYMAHEALKSARAELANVKHERDNANKVASINQQENDRLKEECRCQCGGLLECDDCGAFIHTALNSAAEAERANAVAEIEKLKGELATAKEGIGWQEFQKMHQQLAASEAARVKVNALDLQAMLSIQRILDTRTQHSSQGHFCDWRSACDSICDRLTFGRHALREGTPAAALQDWVPRSELEAALINRLGWIEDASALETQLERVTKERDALLKSRNNWEDEARRSHQDILSIAQVLGCMDGDDTPQEAAARLRAERDALQQSNSEWIKLLDDSVYYLEHAPICRDHANCDCGLKEVREAAFVALARHAEGAK